MLKKYFRLEENHTTLQRKPIAGLTTFVTMAYIIFVQPVVLAATGMDADPCLPPPV
jgi:AGZA family xanthine/uracil permease-like MFS transporter